MSSLYPYNNSIKADPAASVVPGYTINSPIAIHMKVHKSYTLTADNKEILMIYSYVL